MNDRRMAFEKAQGLFDQIGTQEAMDAHLRQSSDQMARGFRCKDRTLCCMDGRVEATGTKHAAGSGVLLAKRYGREYAFEVLANMGLDGIYSHAGCGAAALVSQEMGYSSPEDSEKLAIDWAWDVSLELEIPYRGHLQVRHDFHPERVVYMDGTGRLDSGAAHLLSGFNINAKYPRVEYVREELGIAIGIAFGSHGMGELFTQENPLLVVVIGDSRNRSRSADRIANLADFVIGGSPYADRIRRVRFTPPREWIM